MRSTLDINYFGYLTPLGGYGISNINWIKYLSRAGVNVYAQGTYLPPVDSFEYSILDGEEKDILYREYKKQKIGIIETTPFNFNLIDTEVKVASTMCETNEIGKPWVDACNSMDYVIVPNEFNKRVFSNSGVSDSKLVVIRPGTDSSKFPYFKRPVRELFTFGMVGYMNDRKSVFEVIQAFVSEFELWEPVRLYIKSSNKDFGYYSNFKDPRIVTDIRHVSIEDLNTIYQHFDAFIFPSKAEGVGMPPREAMSTGLPVVVMNYSGLEEISDPTYTYPIDPLTLERGRNPQNIEQVGDWAIPDISELMYWMRFIYEHPEDAAEKGAAASEWIAEEHSWEKGARDLIKFLETIV